MRFILLLVIILLIICPLQPFATEELAEKSGEDCQSCHLDPAGGGELTAIGEGYLLARQGPAVADDTEAQEATSTINYLFKLTIGYLQHPQRSSQANSRHLPSPPVQTTRVLALSSHFC